MNPYLDDLSHALSSHNHVINRNNPSKMGILDIFKYLNRLDILYLNWLEDLPDKRGGIVQSILFILLFFYLKIIGKKVVWTLHNKKSHTEKHIHIKNALLGLLLRRCDLVLTHASEGLSCIPDSTAKVYIPHPIKPIQNSNPKSETLVFDIIIWGAVTKYKAIDTFLFYLIEKELIHSYKILIAGKVIGAELVDTLEGINQEYENVTLLNRFIEEEELSAYIGLTQIILFTYHSESILSSGALMDSLRFNSTIIGPDVGAFRDLAQEALIHTYKDYNNLIIKLDQLLEEKDKDQLSRTIKTERYIRDNNWETFSDRMAKILKNL